MRGTSDYDPVFVFFFFFNSLSLHLRCMSFENFYLPNQQTLVKKFDPGKVGKRPLVRLFANYPIQGK